MPYTPEEKRARALASHRRWWDRNRAELNARMRLKRAARATEINARRREKYRAKGLRTAEDRQHANAVRTAILERKAGRRKPDHCEICGSDETKISFDHCHQRGVFRGWICNNCNVIIGYAKDDPNHLRKIIAYLERTANIIPPQFTLPGI